MFFYVHFFARIRFEWEGVGIMWWTDSVHLGLGSFLLNIFEYLACNPTVSAHPNRHTDTHICTHQAFSLEELSTTSWITNAVFGRVLLRPALARTLQYVWGRCCSLLICLSPLDVFCKSVLEIFSRGHALCIATWQLASNRVNSIAFFHGETPVWSGLVP